MSECCWTPGPYKENIFVGISSIMVKVRAFERRTVYEVIEDS